ncbi:MAG: hypothetical protein K2L81_03870, partial [Muribaculaceae bacterium]|nr:hypothetical protein [Muribaculaceae bacterium]
DNANDSLTSKNATLQDLKEQQTRLESQIAAQESYLKQAQATLKSLQNSSTLAKQDSTSTKAYDWLLTLTSTANSFNSAFKTSKIEEGPQIWYIIAESRAGSALYLSLTATAPTWLPEDDVDDPTWKAITGDGFYDAFVDKKGEYATTTFDNIEVYMGSEYNKITGSETYQINDPASTMQNKSIPAVLLSKLQGLASDNRFQHTVTITTDKYKDPTAAAQTLKDIEDTKDEIAGYQKTITELTRQLKGYHPTSTDWVAGSTEITGVEEKIATVNAALNTLNGSAETEGSIKYFQAAVETAKTAVENDTATSDAITAAKAAISTAQTAYDDAVQGVTDAQDAVDALAAQQTAYETAQSELTAANEAVEAAQKTADSAKDDYDHYLAVAQEASDDAAYTKYYKSVTLTGNLTAAATGVDYDGTIHGGDNFITVTSGNLFNTFSGTLINTAINGNFASSSSKATFENVARWNKTSGKYYNTDGVGTDYTGSNAFGKFGYALRDNANFGVNFQTGEIVAQKKDLLVYDITVNDFNGDPINTQYYVQKNGDGLIAANKAAVAIPTNRFAKSQDEFDFPNVYYGANNYCSNVVIADKVDFYCPVDLTTDNVNLNRTFTQGYNTVCLPFALNYNYAANDDAITALCTYEKAEPSKFWFTKVAGTIPANTPVLVVASKETTLDMTNLASPITIRQTDKTQMAMGVKNSEDNSTSYGTFKKVNAGEFMGQSKIPNIYGINSKGNFQRAGEQANFPSFRMVIATATNYSPSSSPMRAPADGDDERGIGILDENGNDITDKINTGIDYVGADNGYATSLEVIPGQGMITINSEADYGDVAIYSVDGKVAAIANVMAGTTTVNLQHGVYIVLGKKVMVK